MFAHLTIAVRDARASAEFFERTMGWKIIKLPSNVEIDAAWCEIEDGDQAGLLLVHKVRDLVKVGPLH